MSVITRFRNNVYLCSVKIKNSTMVTMTVHYDERNKDAQFLANIIRSVSYMRVEDVKKTKKNSLDRSLDDLKAGRVFEAKDGKDLLEQCLNK